SDTPLLGVNTPRSYADWLELMELTVFLLPKVEKVRIGVNAVDLQVSAIRHQFLLFSLINWCCTLSAVSERFNQIIDFLNGSSIKYALTVNTNIYVSCIKQFWTTIAVKQVNDVTRLQAIVDKKKSWPEWDTRSHPPNLHFTKLSSRASGKQQVDDARDAEKNVDEVNAGDAAHGEVPTVTKEPSIPSTTSRYLFNFPAMDACAALTRRVEHLEFDKVAQALEIIKLKKRVKKLKKRNKVRVLKLMRLQMVGTSQRVDTSDDTVMDDESNQGRMIAEMDQDDAIVLDDDKEKDREVTNAVKDVEEAKDETEPAEVQEVVKVVTTAKLIYKVTAASDPITAASTTIPAVAAYCAPTRVIVAPSRRRKGVERFSTLKPKNFSNDFLLVTLGAMFEKPDIHAQIWKNQRTVHGPEKVKGWKLLKSCGMQIITFTSTQLILLVERKYPLTRFTLNQMLNAVRLEVEEESEVSLELLRFIRQQHQEGQLE
nr:hypothetical protein [Tanacetum cinerariifolium]